ncbi:Transcription factor 12 [Armadillidium vulgare]|nr:Transcription factor 12 [Armadillidium vulgare]
MNSLVGNWVGVGVETPNLRGAGIEEPKLRRNGGTDVWGGATGGGVASAAAGAVGGYSSYPAGPPMMGPSPTHLTQPHNYAMAPHLQDQIQYDHMPSTLPPMATFRGAPGVSSTTSGGTVPTSSPLYTHSPVHSAHSQPTPTGQTGDTLGKALASIYPPDQTSSSFSSNPGTPVSATSPPPLTTGGATGGPQAWQQAHTPSSPHFDRTLPMRRLADDPLEPSLDYLRDPSIEGARIDERLEDACNILQRHAETSGTVGASAGPQPSHLPHTHPASLPPYAAPLDTHLVPPPNSNFTTLGVHTQDLKTLPTPGLSDSMKDKDLKGDEPHSGQPPSIPTSLPSSGQKGGKRSRSDDDESVDPETKAVREKERRMANNARERIRIRDINDALKELGRMCMTHLKSDKPQTKLGILNMAVDVIMSLEQQVRERNLNPKAACLKRREEEKSDGSKLPPPHLPHPSSVGPPYPNIPPSLKYDRPSKPLTEMSLFSLTKVPEPKRKEKAFYTESIKGLELNILKWVEEEEGILE